MSLGASAANPTPTRQEPFRTRAVGTAVQACYADNRPAMANRYFSQLDATPTLNRGNQS